MESAIDPIIVKLDVEGFCSLVHLPTAPASGPNHVRFIFFSAALSQNYPAVLILILLSPSGGILQMLLPTTFMSKSAKINTNLPSRPY